MPHALVSDDDVDSACTLRMSIAGEQFNSEVVLCTGHASLETSIEALRLGAADHLVKPINLKQLPGVCRGS